MADHETYTLPVKVVLGILSSLVSICSICGNLLVLFAFCVDRGVRTSNNYFIISLAVTDFTIGLISLNLLIVYLLLGYWPLGNFICDCWLAIDFTACLVSQVTVFLITLDRYLSVKFPVKYRNWRTDNKLIVMLTLSWVLPAALWIPLVFAWYQMTGWIRPPSDQCNVPFTHSTIFNTILTVSYFWIPLCFMISLYVGIYRIAAGLHQKVQESHRGLADLVLMTGTTMSKIGLSVKVGEAQNQSKARSQSEKAPEQRDYASTRKAEEKSAETSSGSENAVRSSPKEGDNSSPRLQTEHQTEFVDSGLGESNNLRKTSDVESELKRKSSSLSLELPEFCDHYRCIMSPNAPPSRASSVLSECDNPWTRQDDFTSSFRFEDHCQDAYKQSTDRRENASQTVSETRPTQQQNTEKRKGTRAAAFFIWSRRWTSRSQPEEKHSITKTENSSSDGGHQQNKEINANNNNNNNNTILASHLKSIHLGSIQDRFARFQSQKSVEKRKVERRKRRRARKALRMISFILGAFVICWTPYHIIIIAKGFCDIPSQGYSCINEHLYNFAYYMCYMNTPINPFCYAMANIAFKRAFLRILNGDFRRK